MGTPVRVEGGKTLTTDGPFVGMKEAVGGFFILEADDLDAAIEVHSTRAELLRRLGRTDEARDAYQRARQLTDDGAERRFLERRLTELASSD